MSADSVDKEFQDDREEILRALGGSFLSRPPDIPPQNFAPKDDLARRFISAAQENDATTMRVPNESEIPAAAANYLRLRNLALEIVCTAEWRNLPWQSAGIKADFRAPIASDICGVSGVVAAAADCGAMAASGDEANQLTAGLLPPHHIAIVRESEIQPSLADILQTPNGVFALFCGPSRTADIEQTLTLGAHGPLSVHILIVGGGNGGN